mmetsp:Transcript_21209/g.30357  ORF Transcript_21209/g.30357 Transcript_21209/m.30357 type:complete len:98 (+) Transcript_21209:497-790(+)
MGDVRSMVVDEMIQQHTVMEKRQLYSYSASSQRHLILDDVILKHISAQAFQCNLKPFSLTCSCVAHTSTLETYYLDGRPREEIIIFADAASLLRFVY